MSPPPPLMAFPDTGHGPLLVLVCVGGGHANTPLQPTDPRFLERVSGFWIAGLAVGQRLHTVKRALEDGRRVFLLGFHARHVVRAVEVVPQVFPHSPQHFVHVTGMGELVHYAQLSSQPATAIVHGVSFATAYKASGAATRVLYHGIPFDDAPVRGRELVGVPKGGWTTPALYTTSDPVICGLPTTVAA